MHIKIFGLFFIFFLLSPKSGSVGSVLPEMKLVWPYVINIFYDDVDNDDDYY